MSSFRVIKPEPAMKCELCGIIEETRSYGPNGERICYTCGQKDKAMTEKRMAHYIFGDPL